MEPSNSPLPVTCVILMMSEMSSMLFSTTPIIPTWFLSTGNKHLLFPPAGAHDVSTFLSQNNSKLYFFLHELIAFNEQASSRTSWLKAFFCKTQCPARWFMISSCNTTTNFYILCLSSWIFCWLARTSHKPISRTVWLKVPLCKSKSQGRPCLWQSHSLHGRTKSEVVRCQRDKKPRDTRRGPAKGRKRKKKTQACFNSCAGSHMKQWLSCGTDKIIQVI